MKLGRRLDFRPIIRTTIRFPIYGLSIALLQFTGLLQVRSDWECVIVAYLSPMTSQTGIFQLKFPRVAKVIPYSPFEWTGVLDRKPLFQFRHVDFDLILLR